MKNLILLLAISCFISCQKKVEKSYYPDGTLKAVVELSDSIFHGSYKSFYENGELENEANYENGLIHGIVNYYTTDGYIDLKVLFEMDTARYKWGYYNTGEIKDEGFIKDGEKAGRWIHYPSLKDSILEIKEYFHIGENKHLNQVLEVNHQGDTIGGEYFWLSFKEPLAINNQLINFHLKELSYIGGSEFYLCIPTNESENFELDFTNESEVITDTINFDLEKYPSTIELNYTTPGENFFRGFIIEHWESPNPEITDFDLVTRKIYFNEELLIEDIGD